MRCSNRSASARRPRVGGCVAPSWAAPLFAAGAKAVFGPGTNIPRAAAELLEKLNAELGYGPRAAAE